MHCRRQNSYGGFLLQVLTHFFPFSSPWIRRTLFLELKDRLYVVVIQVGGAGQADQWESPRYQEFPFLE